MSDADALLARRLARQSQRHIALKQKVESEGHLTREALMQHQIAKNHQHRESMKRFDEQRVTLARVEQALVDLRQFGVEEESRVKEENKLLAAKYQATVASEGRLTRDAMEDGHERLAERLLREAGEEAKRQRLERLQQERRLEALLESLRQEAAQRSAEDAEQRKQERDRETHATEALRVWEAEEREKDRKKQEAFQQMLLARDEQRELEMREERAAWEAKRREEDAERLARDAETLRLHQEAAEKAEAAASTVKKLELERTLLEAEREQITNRLPFEKMGTGIGPKTATTGASTTIDSTALPSSIAVPKENADPQKGGKKSAEVLHLKQQVRALEVDKRKGEEEKDRLEKRLVLEIKEKERIERQQRGKTRSERIESKKPEETAQGQRATEAAAFDKAKKQEGWRRSTRLRDSNPVKHGKPTYRYLKPFRFGGLWVLLLGLGMPFSWGCSLVPLGLRWWGPRSVARV